ncbi:hypothetical protein [Ferrimonas balearica]|uniref:hypothetical protein n=1 Tax=Ferrimonas balearica TaxID=44012 RepID=UPI001C973BE0|nr:hypothetical protein [Ferrimonas balearica]MBY6225349.1 hypothetical protein [Ferrimonas balearica]
MNRQERASSELFRAWHLGLVLLVVALVMAAALSLLERGPEVPDNVVQSRWLQSLNWVRGQWLQSPHADRMDWKSPDGRQVVLTIDPVTGWPQPVPDCEYLWQALMGQPAEGLVTGIERPDSTPDGCRYRLGDRTVMTYFGRTGSVILTGND